MENQPNLSADTTQLPGNGQSRAAQLSSNATLFWRVFVPIFGTVFLSGLLAAFLFTAEEELYLPFPVIWGRLGVLVLWLGWLLFVRRTVWHLKRLDADDAFVYVTNYWTTVRYPWSEVVRFEEKRRLGRRVMHLCLKAPGRFGREISFLPSSHFYDWMKEHDKQALLLAN